MQEPQVLPMEMSALLELAVNDTAAAAVDPDVQLNMAVWYRKDHPGKCVMCMAGAVMRGRNLVSPHQYEATPHTVANSTKSELLFNQLNAIDDMRLGLFFNAAARLGINIIYGTETDRALKNLGEKIADEIAPEWEWNDDVDAALNTYREVVAELKALGL